MHRGRRRPIWYLSRGGPYRPRSVTLFSARARWEARLLNFTHIRACKIIEMENWWVRLKWTRARERVLQFFYIRKRLTRGYLLHSNVRESKHVREARPNLKKEREMCKRHVLFYVFFFRIFTAALRLINRGLSSSSWWKEMDFQSPEYYPIQISTCSTKKVWESLKR